MQTMNWRSVTLIDQNQNRHDGAGEGAVSFRYETFENGYTCYVSAHWDAGLDGDESLILIPDIPDTSDYLSIINHSPYWCRPAWGGSLSELHTRTNACHGGIQALGNDPAVVGDHVSVVL